MSTGTTFSFSLLQENNSIISNASSLDTHESIVLSMMRALCGQVRKKKRRAGQ